MQIPLGPLAIAHGSNRFPAAVHRHLQRPIHRHLLLALCLLSGVPDASRLRHAVRGMRPKEEHSKQHAQELVGRVRRRLGVLQRGLRVRLRWERFRRPPQDFFGDGKLLFDGGGRFDVLVVSVRFRRDERDHRGGDVGGTVSDGGVLVLFRCRDGVFVSGGGARGVESSGVLDGSFGGAAVGRGGGGLCGIERRSFDGRVYCPYSDVHFGAEEGTVLRSSREAAGGAGGVSWAFCCVANAGW